MERDRERDLLRSALERTAVAEHAHGSIVVVQAAAGLGKSVLLDDTARTARSTGMRVLRARGDEAGRSVPFGILQQLLAREVLALAPERRSALRETPAGALLAAFDPASGAAQPLHELQVANGLWWLLSELADETPTCVLVDDLQWADRGSLAALAFLATRIDDLAIALIGAQRSGVVSDHEDALVALRTAPSTRVVEPVPLSAEASAELVHAHLPGSTGDDGLRAWRATGGNPFLLTQLLAWARSNGVRAAAAADAVSAVGSEVPPQVLESVRRRIATQSADAAEVAAAAAVLDVRATVTRIAGATGIGIDRTAVALDELVRLDLVRLTDDTVTFRHPLLRAAVEMAYVGPAVRPALARRCADVLDRDGEAATVVASFLLDATHEGDERTAERLVDAAASATASGGAAQAVRFARRALDEGVVDDALRVRAWRELGRAHEVLGDVSAAVDAYEQAFAAEADPTTRSLDQQQIANVLVGASDLPGAISAYQRAAEVLGEAPEHERQRRTVLARADAFLSAGRPNDPGAAPTELLAQDPRLDTHDDRVVLSSLAVAEVFNDVDADRARALGFRALAGDTFLREETADGQHLYVATAALTWTDAHAEVTRVLDGAVADARSRGSVLGHASAMFCRGGGFQRAGDLVRAAADLEAAIEASADGWNSYLPNAAYHGALAFLDIGMPQRAIQLVELAVGTDPTTFDRWGILESFAHAALSVAQRARGDDHAAIDTMLRTGQLEAPTGLRSTAVADWRHTAAELAVRIGRGDEVRDVAAESLERARRFGADRALGMALHVDALLQDDPGARIDGLLHAAERHERAGARWEHARVLGDVALCHASAERGEDARTAATRALELATACGARPFATSMRELLQRIGGSSVPTGAEPSNRALLTPGELRVADLAAAGRTNREIAQVLFVTVKAVEWHLSNTYRKLGVSGRRALAEALASSG